VNLNRHAESAGVVANIVEKVKIETISQFVFEAGQLYQVFGMTPSVSLTRHPCLGLWSKSWLSFGAYSGRRNAVQAC
jgi:hypothetical protein